MGSHDYFVLQEDHDETSVYIGDFPREITRKYQLLEGVSRLADWPERVALRYAKHRPEGMVLTDALANPFGWLIASRRLWDLLQSTGLTGAEALPVVIHDHKGRLAGNDYSIVNLLRLVEAVDRSGSIFEVDAADDDLIYTFDRLVLRQNVLDSGPHLFRLKEQPRLLLMRNDVVGAARQAGISGLKYVGVNSYRTHDPED